MAEKVKKGFFGKLLKWGLIVGGVLLAVIAAAPYFIDWNALKDKGTAYLSQTLKHKVTIDSISVGIFTGVTLNKVTIGNAAGFGRDPLFYNEKAVLRPSLLSIFTGKIVIKEIEFKNPKVLIEKNAQGAFNFSDMTAASKSQNASAGKKDSAAPNVIIVSFKLTGGELTYRDMKANKTTSVKGLDILLAGFSLRAGGKSRLEIKFTAELEGKKIPLSLASNFALDLDGQKINLDTFDFKAPSVAVHASGDVSEFKGDPKLNLGATIDLKLDSIVADLAPPSSLKSLPADLKASGSIKLKADLKGRLSKPENLDLKAVLAFDKVGLKSNELPPVENMSGEFTFGPTSARLPGLSLNMGGSPVNLSLDLSDYSLKGLMGPAKDLRIKVKYALTSPKLVMEPLMAFAAMPDSPETISKKAAENRRTGGIKDYRSKVSKGITVNGLIKVEAVQFKEILTGQLQHVVELKAQRMKSTLSLKLFEGTLWNQLEADLSVPGPKNVLHAVASKVQIEKAVNAAANSFPKNNYLQQLKGKVVGSLSFDVKGHGRGSQAPALNKNLVLEGNFGVKDGVIRKLDVQEKLAAAVPHPDTQQVMRKDIPFGQMGGKIALKNEKVTLTDFYMSSGADHRGGELLIQASGTQVMGGAVDFKITPRFNPRVVKLEGIAADGFNDELGWATYNYISYKGADSKSAKADYLQGAKSAAKKIVDKQIEKARQQAQDEGKKVIEEKSKDLLKQLPGLFGK